MENFSHCPQCGKRFSVADSRVRNIHGTQTVWRRKKCRPCGVSRNTLEISETLAKRILALAEKTLPNKEPRT